YGGAGRRVDDFAIEQGHPAFQVFDLVGGDGVEIAVPDGDVGSFADLECADFVFQEHLARAPCGVTAESGVDVHGFFHPERVDAVRAFGGLPRGRCPEAVARGNRSDEVV